MKKIIFFAYDMNIGGMEKALLILLNRLVQKHEVTLVLEHKTGPLLQSLNSSIKVEEYKVSNINFVPLRKMLNGVHRLLWSIKHKNKYDFSCSYATYSVIGSRLALVASTNTCLYVHSDYYDYYKGDERVIRAFFEELRYDCFKKVLFVAKESKQKLESILPGIAERSKVIGNLVDYKEIMQLSKCCNEVKEQIEQTKTLFLFVGRLEEESKRLSRLIEAFSYAVAQKDNILLWIVGEGKDYAFCEELIEKYKVKEHVKMLGKKKNPYPYIAQANCILITSDFEGYPVVYNECMVLKKPIITTVPVSDGYIDIREYATVVEKDSNVIANAIIDFRDGHMEEKWFDFEEFNEKKINDMEEIISGK